MKSVTGRRDFRLQYSVCSDRVGMSAATIALAGKPENLFFQVETLLV